MAPEPRPPEEIVVGAAVSLSGRYARQGGMAAAGLAQAVDDARRTGGVAVGGRRRMPVLALLDDGGTAEGLCRALDALASTDLLLGPYGSGLTGEAAAWAAERGRVLWNHGGSADEVEAMAGVVSVASPTSRYLAAVVEALAPGVPAGSRVLVGAGTGSFGRAAAGGALDAARRAGFDVAGVVAPGEVPARPGADVVLLAGSFEEDVAVVRRLEERPAALAAVAAGLAEFPAAAGPSRAAGVLAPTQWEEGLRLRPDLGPRAVDVVRGLRSRLVPGLGTGPARVDYPAAQAYAAVVIALHCATVAGGGDDAALLSAARGLRATTFFGRFGLGPDGRQEDHDIVVVQWEEGAKRIVGPPGLAERPPRPAGAARRAGRPD